MPINAQGTDDYILVVIRITVWIQEIFKGFFIITLISHNGGMGGYEKVCTLREFFQLHFISYVRTSHVYIT